MIRIVRMGFAPEKVEIFVGVFEASKEKIRAFPGCQYLELMRDTDDTSVFITYSVWENPQALENYRRSELFKTTWAQTKPLFNRKPIAFSAESLLQLL